MQERWAPLHIRSAPSEISSNRWKDYTTAERLAENYQTTEYQTAERPTKTAERLGPGNLAVSYAFAAERIFEPLSGLLIIYTKFFTNSTTKWL